MNDTMWRSKLGGNCKWKFYFQLCILMLLLVILLEGANAVKTSGPPPPLNITAVTGIGLELRCKVKLQECGNFYSIEWYRDKGGGGHVNNDGAEGISHATRKQRRHHHSEDYVRQRRNVFEDPTVLSENSGIKKSVKYYSSASKHQVSPTVYQQNRFIAAGTTQDNNFKGASSGLNYLKAVALKSQKFQKHQTNLSQRKETFSNVLHNNKESLTNNWNEQLEGESISPTVQNQNSSRFKRQLVEADSDEEAAVVSTVERVYVYRHHSGLSKSEGPWEGRADHQYDTKRHVMTIRLSPLLLDDEASYRCEITYEETGRWFKHSCLAPQTTRLAVLGRPTYVTVNLENGTKIESGGVVGPFTEGSLLILRCKSGGGRPIPEVSWWRGSEVISNAWHWRVEHDNGTGSTQSEINLIMSRDFIGQTLDCKVNSTALDSPIVHSVHVDLEVAPNSLKMIGSYSNTSEHSVIEGMNITVTCEATGAKPPAYIYWNSDPELFQDDTHEEISREENGVTFKTVNRLTFQARRQLTSLSCFASNKILDDKKSIHLKRDTTINVKYRPVVEKLPRIEMVNAVHGEPISLVCRFTANPTAGVHVKWYRNGRMLDRDRSNDKRTDKADGSVLRLDAEKSAEGLYACSAENELGRSNVVDIASVSVEEKPRVRIVVEPELPLSESQNANVTLKCRLEDQPSERYGGSHFASVKWYLDGELLKHVEKNPDCLTGSNLSHSHHCHVDPSKIILVNVRRSFRGNYSCRGQNRAGWGPLSQPTELHVLYPPKNARISYEPPIIKKGQIFQIKCALEDLGYPFATKVRWYHNGHEMYGRNTFIMTIRSADVSAAGNYTCSPYNEEGEAQSTVASIRIFAPPTFIQPLPLFTGTPYNKQIGKLKCIVECDPLCSVMWYRNSSPIAGGIGSDIDMSNSSLFELSDFLPDKHYVIRSYVRTPDPTSNLFHHVESVLELDFDRWPGGSLVPSRDTANYTCKSSMTSVGPGVESTTIFRVHYPPKNISVSPKFISVPEKSRLDPLHCQADAYPLAKYYWQFEEGNRTLNGADVEFRHPVRREQSGTYTCVAYNDLGSVKASVQLSVIYRPICRLRKIEFSGSLDDTTSEERSGLHLRCDVEANPPNVTYIWYHNDAPLPREVGSSLYFRNAHDSGNLVVGNFSCEAKNVVGVSERCGIRVNGPVAALVAETDLTLLMFGGGAVVVLFVLVLVGILICRHQNGMGSVRGMLKYNIQTTNPGTASKSQTPGIGSHCNHAGENPYGSLTQLKEEGEGDSQLKEVPHHPAEDQLTDPHVNNNSNGQSVIINGNCSVNSLEPDPVQAASAAELTSFKKVCNLGAEEVVRRQNNDIPMNRFEKAEMPKHRNNLNYNLDGPYGRIDSQSCSIPGSNQRPPPPQYRRSDFIVKHRDYEDGQRIMTLDRRRLARSNHEDHIRYYQSGMMSGDATMVRHVKYSMVNQPNVTRVIEREQMYPRGYVMQNGRRNDLWLV